MGHQVLVTGGAGYIGSHTTQKLLDNGYDVTVLDNLSTGFAEAVPSDADFVKGDIRDQNFVSQLMKEKSITSVVHFAAKLIVPESIEKPYEYYENNVGGSLSLIKACKQNNVTQFVFSSTAAVYGEANADALITESSLTSPLNPYGSSKLMVEQILKDADLAYGLRSVILRYFNVAGGAVNGLNGQRTQNATHLIKVAAQAALGTRPQLNVFGTDYATADGTCIRDYIHVEDLAEAHVKALEHLYAGKKSSLANCGYGQGFSVLEVLSTMKKISGNDFVTIYDQRRAGDARSLVADSSHLQNNFDWKPKRNNLELICKTAYEWEKSLNERTQPKTKDSLLTARPSL